MMARAKTKARSVHTAKSIRTMHCAALLGLGHGLASRPVGYA